MKRVPSFLLALMALGCLTAMAWAQVSGGPPPKESAKMASQGDVSAPEQIVLWEPLFSPKFANYEKIALCANVVVALLGLAYAWMLVSQVRNAPEGTPRMQEIARAVREGANAYLYRQFRVVGVLIVVITIALYFAAQATNAPSAISIGRALAFFLGSIFSAMVGFVGMRLATIGNLRVAAAARDSLARRCSSATARGRSPAC